MNTRKVVRAQAFLALCVSSLCQCTLFLGVGGLDEGGDGGSDATASAETTTRADARGDALRTAEASREAADNEGAPAADSSPEAGFDAPETEDDATLDTTTSTNPDANGRTDTGTGAKDTGTGTTPDAGSEASSNDDTYVLIDDMQTGNGKIDIGTGSWFAYNDGSGGVESPVVDSLISPPRTVIAPFVTFTGSPSTLAAHASGSGFSHYAAMGITLESPRAAFPTHDYDGVVFWARLGNDAGSIVVYVQLPDVDTDPQGDVCTTECFDYLATNVTVTGVWQEFKVPFASLKQTGFGVPKETTLASAGIYGIQFQVDTANPAGEAFDLWIDDVYFYTGP